MNKLLSVIAIAALAGCATAPNIAGSAGAQFAHADMQNAAAYATKNGFPARSAVWQAIDAQVTACENALSAAAPVAQTGVIGAAMLLEMAAEAAGTGVPAAVRVNCAPVPLVVMPIKP